MYHFQHPRNQGKLDHPDLIGVAGAPGCGRFVILQLARSETRDRVIAARFQGDGCGSTIAIASVLTELVTGRTVAECRELTVSKLLLALDGLPPDKEDCADFVLISLRQAIDQILK